MNAVRFLFGLALIAAGILERATPVGHVMACFGVYVVGHALSKEARGR